MIVIGGGKNHKNSFNILKMLRLIKREISYLFCIDSNIMRLFVCIQLYNAIIVLYNAAEPIKIFINAEYTHKIKYGIDASSRQFRS